MPRNVYFSPAVKSEQNVYEDLVIEALKIYGQDVYYLPRTIVNRDDLLGEVSASRFDDAYMLEAYIENPDGFEGQGDLYSKFGLEIRDEVNFIISRRQWNKFIGVHSDEVKPQPMEGDVIFLPMTNKFFEITFIEHEQPFYQLSNLPVYKLQCSLYEYSDETIDTGVAAIDAIQPAAAYQIGLEVAVTLGNHFEIGDIVTQTLATGVTVFGEVQTITKASNDMSATISVSNIGSTDTRNAEEKTDSYRSFFSAVERTAFSEGNAVLYAADTTNPGNYGGYPTYFVDLGVTGQDLVNGAVVDIPTHAGLHAFFTSNPGAKWTVIGSVNDDTLVAGPPVAGMSYLNRGVVGTAGSDTDNVGSSGATNEQQRAIMNDWIEDMQDHAAGATSFGVDNSHSVAADSARDGGFFWPNSAVPIGSVSSIFYAQASPEPETDLADPTIVNRVGTAGTAAQSLAKLETDGSITINTGTDAIAPAALPEVGYSNELVGSKSGNTCKITKVYTLDQVSIDNTFPADSQAKNVQFEVEADNFIDFSESNPFGDPSERY